MRNRWIFQGTRTPHDGIDDIPKPPPWRQFEEDSNLQSNARLRGQTFHIGSEEIDLINVALYLRRPLFVTGTPGTGKSSLAYAIAYELKLEPVLYWPINSSSTLKEGLYSYDAMSRLEQAQAMKIGKELGLVEKTEIKEDFWDVGRFITLGPLGTALLPTSRPRVLLIDEIDKSDIDLPNDLLNVFEEGEFSIPELARRPSEPETGIQVYTHRNKERAFIQKGRVICNKFPIIVLTSNRERELPPAFMRRCIYLEMPQPDKEQLERIVEEHFKGEIQREEIDKLIEQFLEKRGNKGSLANDQLLNAIYLVSKGRKLREQSEANILDAIFKPLDSTR